MTDAPPICLFAHRRPRHLERTVEALAGNADAADHDLVVFCDGAARPADAEAVAEVRQLAAGIEGFRSVRVVERDRNLGLSASIVAGVTEVVGDRGRVVVVEDDLVTSRYFLQFLRDGLELYAGEPRVASIHGYVYPVSEPLPETFFLRGADCWGWATWRRAWQRFEPDGRKLLAELDRRRLRAEFDLGGARRLTRMLRDQVAGRNDSWAIRWHAAAFLEGMLTLYPGRSLVHNIGTDASGTHGGSTGRYRVEVADAPIAVEPLPIAEDRRAADAVAAYFRRSRSLPRRLLGLFRR